MHYFFGVEIWFTSFSSTMPSLLRKNMALCYLATITDNPLLGRNRSFVGTFF